MNPHFIYNTINGIQSVMILKGEEMANKYVGVFSKMLRTTMDMAVSENLSLADEIEYLRSYVLLQNIRLEYPIKIVMEFDENINPQKVLILPMLLQPIIENSVLHGLSSLKRSGNIVIKARTSQDLLHLVIEDDGIGRKASLDKKKLNMVQHKSHATKILKERIDLLNYLEKAKSEFYLEDLVKNARIIGTRAVLTIPKKINT